MEPSSCLKSAILPFLRPAFDEFSPVGPATYAMNIEHIWEPFAAQQVSDGSESTRRWPRYIHSFGASRHRTHIAGIKEPTDREAHSTHAISNESPSHPSADIVRKKNDLDAGAAIV